MLRDGLDRYSSVNLRSRAEVLAIEQHTGHVLLRYEELAAGGLRQCRVK